MQPDRDQIEILVDAAFRHAGSKGFVSLRWFYEGAAGKKPEIRAVPMSGGLPFLIESAEDCAFRAADHPKPMVFAPPLAVFANQTSAKEADILALGCLRGSAA
jgi:hypothetical protein